MWRLLLISCLFVACGSIRPAPRYTDSLGSGGVVRELEKRRRASPDRLAHVVEGYLGVPYKWGGTTRAGMDCSAFTRAIFRETYGVELPRTSKQMYGVGRAVARRQDLKPGDLVFFENTYSGPGVSHVGIYLSEGRFAHASSSEGGTITPLDNPYFQPRYVGARRIER
ncbi:MAG: C40 family peptidase [Candidatus Latescibacterota bacterium]|nr:C40 family peptidase [Candidatus Latescibacterota bacterium]